MSYVTFNPPPPPPRYMPVTGCMHVLNNNNAHPVITGMHNTASFHCPLLGP